MKFRETSAVEQAPAGITNPDVAADLAKPGSVLVDDHVNNAEIAGSVAEENHAEADPERIEAGVVEPAKGERSQDTGYLAEQPKNGESSTDSAHTGIDTDPPEERPPGILARDSAPIGYDKSENNSDDYEYGGKNFRVTRYAGNAYIRWPTATAAELANQREFTIREVIDGARRKAGDDSKQSDNKIAETDFFPSLEIIPAGTRLYHQNLSPDVLASGEFEPNEQSPEMPCNGAMFFTPVPSRGSNSFATLRKDLFIFNQKGLRDTEKTFLVENGWEGAAARGCDGRSYANPDPNDEISQGLYAEDLAIFPESYHKIGEIQPIESENISSTAGGDVLLGTGRSRPDAPILDIRERPNFGNSIEHGPIGQVDMGTFRFVHEAIKRGFGRPQNITHHGESVPLGRVLGEGGTKRVFDARIAGEPVALALPIGGETSEFIATIWQETLREQPVTDTIRNLGLRVNTRFDVTIVNIDGPQFPAITMARYEDLPFEVRDRNNSYSSIVMGNLFDESLTLDSFLEMCNGLTGDTATLVEHGVKLNSDSFNLCRDSGLLRLYLNDLSDAEFTNLDEEAAAKYAARASASAIHAVIKGQASGEARTNEAFFEGSNFHRDAISTDVEIVFQSGPAFQRFTAKVLAECGISS